MSDSNPSREEQQQVFQGAPPAAPPQNPNLPPQRAQVPVDVVALPSKGLVYGREHPLANEDETEIRCMTAREEDLLTSRALIKNGTVMSKLLQSCMMNKLVDPDTLLMGDRNALLIAVRVTGYGPEYSAAVTCNECGEESEQDFNMSELTIKPLGAKPVHENTNVFEKTLPMSGDVVQFRLLSGKDDAELTKISKRRKKLKSEVENTVTDRLTHSIVAINGDTNQERIAKAVHVMRAGDSSALRKYMAKIEPDVDMKQWFTCSSCGEESEVEIPLGIGFFWPDFG